VERLGRSRTAQIAVPSFSAASWTSDGPVLAAPSHDSIWSDQKRSRFLDLANALPLAVQVLLFRRAGHDDPQKGKIEATDRRLPCGVGKTGHR
jgi:hypothetical protein